MSRSFIESVAGVVLVSVLWAQEPKGGEEGQEETPKDRPGNAAEGYDAYLELQAAKYVAPAAAGGAQLLELKFNLSVDIPKGAKIQLALERFGLEHEVTEYTLKDDKRTDLTFQWRFQKKLATGEEYQLRTHLHLKDQTPAVQKLIRANQKKFPPKSDPWSWYLKEPVLIGTPEEAAAQGETLCAIYTALMDKLVENHNELKEKMDAAREGKELVKGGSLDKEAFEKAILEWRKKQGAVQKEIRELQAKEPGLVQKAPAAYAKLVDLGRMVSKRGGQLQKEVSDQYKQPLYNPAVEDFDRSFRYKADFETLVKSYENIRTVLNCAKEEEPVEEAPAEGAEGAADAEKPAGEAPDAEKPADEGSGEEPKPEESKPGEPEPKEEPKKEEKKAPAKKAPPKGGK